MPISNANKFFAKFKNLFVLVVCYGGLVGILVGFFVSLFNLGADFITKSSVTIYGWFASHPAFIPILFAGLAALAGLMMLIHKAVPQVRGSGIPQTEGVVRGIVTFRWLRVFITTFIGSYLSFFAGLSLGAEGPSVQIGATCANGVSKTLGARLSWQRYLIGGGAATGLAVAFNAPLSGIIFALEEVNKKFSPMILMTASSSVIFGTITYRLFSSLWGKGNTYLFNMGTITPLPTKFLWTLLIVGLVCGAVAIFFNWSLIKSQKFLDKYTRQYPYWARLIIVFMLTGVVGLLLSDANGGGHGLIMKISTLDFSIQMLLVLLVVKLLMIVMCYNSGATGGLFVPMLAIGALLGGLLGRIFIAAGLPPQYYKAVVCIAMTTFFGASVRAPITATVLIVEITGFSANFLASIIAIFTAFLVAELLGNRPIYESMLERYAKSENKNKTLEHVIIKTEVGNSHTLVGKCVSDVMWPANCLVTNIIRGEDTLVSDGETVIEQNDSLVIEAETYDENTTRQYLAELISDKIYYKRQKNNDVTSQNNDSNNGDTTGENTTLQK